MKYFIRIALFAFFVLAFSSLGPSYALEQSGLKEEEKELTMAIIQHKRKKIVAQNIALDKGEEKAFWNLYDQYQKEIKELGKKRISLIEEYAKAYKSKSLTDKQALTLLNAHLLNELVRIRKLNAYIQKFKEIIPPKKTVRLFQVENKMNAIINFELAAQIPLVPVD
jgi:hypothetical protein